MAIALRDFLDLYNTGRSSPNKGMCCFNGIARFNLYPLTRRRPLTMWSVRNTRIKSTRIANVDLINTILSTMPSNLTSNDIDIIQPTQYNVQPNRVAKNLPPEPWPLLDFTTALYF